MKSAHLTVNIWCDGRRKLPDEHGAIAELFAPHLEHIQGLCEQGIQSGDVCDERFRGWWAIKEGNVNL